MNQSNEPQNEPMTEKDWDLCKWASSLDTYEEYLDWFKKNKEAGRYVQNRIPSSTVCVKKMKDEDYSSVNLDAMEKYSKWYRETMFHNREDFKDHSGQICPEHEWDSWKNSRDSDPWELETKVVVVRDPEWEKMRKKDQEK